MRCLLELVQHLLNLGSLRVYSMLLVLNELYQDSVIKAAAHQDLTFLFAGGGALDIKFGWVRLLN